MGWPEGKNDEKKNNSVKDDTYEKYMLITMINGKYLKREETDLRVH